MKLRNEFTIETRDLFNCFKCWICSANGSKYGGIELHHITGRGSDSPFNCAPLCKRCHGTMGHSVGEERFLVSKTFTYLRSVGYKPTEKDWQFIEDRPHLIKDNDSLNQWLNLK